MVSIQHWGALLNKSEEWTGYRFNVDLASDSIAVWHTQTGHTIQRRTADHRFCCLRVIAPAAQAVREDRLEAEEGGLNQ